MAPIIERAMKRKPLSKYPRPTGPTVVKAAGGQL
jgi:hypothetical protein